MRLLVIEDEADLLRGLVRALRDRGKGAPPERGVTMDQLVAAVREKQAQKPEQAVVIGADKEVKYDLVLKVMDQLQRQNVKRVGLLVRPGA